jgi:hypothetical protein
MPWRPLPTMRRAADAQTSTGRAGRGILATAKAERVVAGGRAMETAPVRITEAGRKVLVASQTV